MTLPISQCWRQTGSRLVGISHRLRRDRRDRHRLRRDRRHRHRQQHIMSSSRHPTILTLLQWAILITSSLFYVMARNSGLMANMLLNTYQAKAREERFLLSRATSTSIDQDDQPSGVRNKSGWALKKPDTLPRDDSSPELSQLEAFLNASKITETGRILSDTINRKLRRRNP